MSPHGNAGRSHRDAEAARAAKKRKKEIEKGKKTDKPNVITFDQYEAMIAKLEDEGKSREEAAERLKHYRIR